LQTVKDEKKARAALRASQQKVDPILKQQTIGGGASHSHETSSWQPSEASPMNPSGKNFKESDGWA